METISSPPKSDPSADKAEALKLTPVSRETEARLDRYLDLLREWQAKTNLVAPSTLPRSTHIFAAGAIVRSCSESATCRVQRFGSVDGATRLILACHSLSRSR